MNQFIEVVEISITIMGMLALYPKAVVREYISIFHLVIRGK